jgi:hypothetical protein
VLNFSEDAFRAQLIDRGSYDAAWWISERSAKARLPGAQLGAQRARPRLLDHRPPPAGDLLHARNAGLPSAKVAALLPVAAEDH